MGLAEWTPWIPEHGAFAPILARFPLVRALRLAPASPRLAIAILLEGSTVVIPYSADI